MTLTDFSGRYRKNLDLSKIGSIGLNAKRAFVLIVVAISSTLYPTKVNSQDKRIDEFETLVKEFEDSLSFNGVLLMADSLGTLYAKSVGYANFESTFPHSTESKFRIASLSKMFVSYMIFILVDQGKLKLDDPLGELVPMLSTSFKEQITIRALLNHTSGLIRDIDKLSTKSQRDYFTTDEIIQLVNLSSLQSEPGLVYSYSNVGYSLLGIIIENVTGEKLNTAFQTLLGKPLHLTSSGHEEGNKVVEALSPGYDMLLDEVYRSAYEDKSHVFAAGSFYSNVNDLAIFAREIIEGSLLSDSLHVRYLATTQNNRTEGAWITYTYRSDLGLGPEKGKFLTFSGLCPGYSSFLGIFLDHKIIVAGLSNLTPMNTALLRNKFGNVAVGLPKELVIKPMWQKVLPIVCDGKLELAVQEYQSQLIKNRDNTILASELNQIGYIFLSHHRIIESVYIFRFASMIFPDNPNVWDSLGEALLKKGDIGEGLDMYRKSLSLNPNNEGARQVLETYKTTPKN